MAFPAGGVIIEQEALTKSNQYPSSFLLETLSEEKW
jgi:hypothetical protein